MRKWIGAIFALAIVMVAVPAVARDDQALAAIAQTLQRLVGSGERGVIEVSSVTIEDDVLVITIDAIAGFGTYDRNRATDAFLKGFCRNNANRLFSAGRLRIDTLERGTDRRSGRIVTSCEGLLI